MESVRKAGEKCPEEWEVKRVRQEVMRSPQEGDELLKLGGESCLWRHPAGIE